MATWNDPDRRRFLRSVAASAGLCVVLAGCTGSSSDDNGTQRATDRQTDESSDEQIETTEPSDERTETPDADTLPAGVSDDGTIDVDQLQELMAESLRETSFEVEWRAEFEDTEVPETLVWAKLDAEERLLVAESTEGAGHDRYYVDDEEAYMRDLLNDSVSEWEQGSYEMMLDNLLGVIPTWIETGLTGYQYAEPEVEDGLVVLEITDGENEFDMRFENPDGSVSIGQSGTFLQYEAKGDTEDGPAIERLYLEASDVTVEKPDWVDDA